MSHIDPQPEQGGYIGHFGLSQWWQDTFTPEERQYMAARHRPVSASLEIPVQITDEGSEFSATTGAVKISGVVANTSSPLVNGKPLIAKDRTAAQFLFSLAGWFRRSQDRDIQRRILEKAGALAASTPDSGPGTYNGRHFTTYVNDVKQHVRSGDFPEAEQLLLKLVEVMETESKQTDRGVGSWYYEELAKIYHRQKDHAREIAVLERYTHQPVGPGGYSESLLDRLARARRSFGPIHGKA